MTSETDPRAVGELRIAERGLVLDDHIAHLWNRLPRQSRARLKTLAISAGVSKSHPHRELVGALELIAREEGAPEAEFDFARTYLGSAIVCERIAAAAGSRKPEARSSEASSFQLPASRSQRGIERARGAPVIALDGEGITLEDGSHVYRYMAAADNHGRVLAHIDRPNGISTLEALRFISRLPKHDESGARYAGVFGYGLGYDRTKWLERLTNESLWKLTHDPDAKVKYHQFILSYMGTCLTVVDCERREGERQTLVWDIIKAFQCKFVDALKRWKIGNPEVLAFLTNMKNARGNFADDGWKEVTEYCRMECKLLAELVYTYLQAHVDADIDLRGQYHGAGSTGGAFLREVGAEEKLCKKEPLATEAYASAFFGGRAEISRLGTVQGPFHVYDIASAYPDALYRLPCMTHGRWRLIQGENQIIRALKRTKFACIRYEIDSDRDLVSKLAAKFADSRRGVWGGRSSLWEFDVLAAIKMKIGESVPGFSAWGPLPYRTKKGSIVFADSGPGGWIWSVEYDIARKHYPGVKAVEAWTFGTTSPCKCGAPFARIGEWFQQRVKWGAEGRGLVIKLGLNSMYGKTAQTIGKNPKYACRVIAGLITATTRARIIEAIAHAEDRWDVVYVATDGIISLSPIPQLAACETSTGAKGTLGQWEHSTLGGSIHMIQPGFYFSLTDDKKVKTRGTPAAAILERRQAIIDEWERAPMTDPKGLPQRSSFRGIKSSILPPTTTRDTYERKADYGRWVKEEHRTAYVWYPKRSMVLQDFKMATWRLDPSIGPSLPYGMVKSDEVEKLEAEDAVNADQPDWRDGGTAVEGDAVADGDMGE